MFKNQKSRLALALAFAFASLLAGCGKRASETSERLAVTPQTAAKPTAAGPAGTALTEKQKIAALLDIIEKSKCTFIRNDQEYPAWAARQLMEYKLNKAGDQIRTADDFIKQVATRSSTTGRVYQVRLSDGRTTESALWVRARLAEIEGKTR